MKYVILILGSALGFRSEIDGNYIEDYMPDNDPAGLGTLLVTDNIKKAKQFGVYREAWEFWKQQSRRVPFRPDGEPNRPLTAYCVEILELGN